jgi:type IX secretion system PorP/SprF family membrane protein
MIRCITFIVLCSAILPLLNAQEIHFSQTTNQQLLINPSLTGHFDADFRFGSGYRSQGASFSVPYITYSAWGEYKRNLNKIRNGAIGLGVSAYNDNAGNGSLQTSAAYISASFIRGFNHDNTFKAALGFSVGFLNRSIDITKLVFDSQWNGTIFDPEVAIGEPFAGNSHFSPDFNFGGLISWEINPDLQTSFGAALHHINRPNLSFYESENRITRRFNAHVLVKNRINDNFQLNVGAYYSMQQEINQVLFGANLLIIRSEMIFLLGLWHRVERDIIPHVGFIARDFLLEFSYDVNVSKLHLASNYRGGFEITMIKTISYRPNRQSCYEF